MSVENIMTSRNCSGLIWNSYRVEYVPYFMQKKPFFRNYGKGRGKERRQLKRDAYNL